MKKIAITTSVSICNYGTKLQALAMCEVFKKRGYQPLILEYSETNKLSFFQNLKRNIGKVIKPLIFGRNYMLLSKYKMEYGKENEVFQSNILTRYLAIDANDNLIPHYRFIGTKTQLKNYASRFDIVVTGSDQVWHPILNKSNLWFFTLNFASSGIKKIAYAPSLGVDELSKDQANYFRPLIDNIDFISLREVSGVKAIQKITDKPVSLVLDPTLLIGRDLWDKLYSEEKTPQKESYCLCYLLGTNPKHREICELVASKMNLKILNFSHFKAYNESDEKLSGIRLYDVSPLEFIGLIKNAKFVITDSFHCSVFSMMYHIPFMTLLRFQSCSSLSTNTRIYSMLQQFGLGNRILTDEENVDSILKSNIDFESVEQKLIEKRRDSNFYLDNALQNEPSKI